MTIATAEEKPNLGNEIAEKLSKLGRYVKDAEGRLVPIDKDVQAEFDDIMDAFAASCNQRQRSRDLSRNALFSIFKLRL